MKKTIPIRICGLFALFCSLAGAADVAGKWQAKFQGPRGEQTYQFTFATDGEKLTGKAVSDMGGRKREAELVDGKFSGDTLGFTEVVNFGGNEMRIVYTGKIDGDGISFTRKVGDFGSSEFKATRGEAPEAQPAGGRENPRGGRGGGGPVELGPDDKPAYEAPPAGFNAKREDVPHGKLEMVEYDSKTVGAKRKMQVYTPPGYSKDKKYPVLYLKEKGVPHVWHVDGLGHDATHWSHALHFLAQKLFR